MERERICNRLKNNNLRDVILQLIRISLWEEANFSQINLSLEDWEYIYNQSKAQAVHGIVYDAIQKLPLNQQPPKSVQIKWAIDVNGIEKANMHQQKILNELLFFYFNNLKIGFRLVKGQAIAQHYKNSNHRVCGDLDLWISSIRDLEIANNTIEENGITVKRGGNHDSIYTYKGVDIEHHYRLIEICNPFFQKELEDYGNAIYKITKFEPTQEAHLFLQITHILKHQLNEGIGLRQICDLAVCLSTFDYNHIELSTLCKKYKVYKWAQLLFSLLTEYFGVSKDILPFPPNGNAEILLNEIWESGNFGQNEKRFGFRPKGVIRGKLYTANIMLQKFKLFYKYVPEESFWNLVYPIYKRLAKF